MSVRSSARPNTRPSAISVTRGDKNIGFVSSFDQRKSLYHPQIKIPVGERAAKWALASKYDPLAAAVPNKSGCPRPSKR